MGSKSKLNIGGLFVPTHVDSGVPVAAAAFAPGAVGPGAVQIPGDPSPPQTLANNILMRSIKILDIGYITVIYFIIAICLAILTDKIMGKFDEEKAKKTPRWKLLLEVLLHLWIYGVMTYVVRNLVELVPFPLDGYQGFMHKHVKEIGSAWTFGFVYLMFSAYLRDKLTFLYNDFMKSQSKLDATSSALGGATT
jgi:hypothetical protein